MSIEYVPLSAAQRSVWYAQQLAPRTPIHIAQYIEIEGPLDHELFDRVARIGAHEVLALNARLVEEDGTVHQILDPDASVSIPLVDLSGEPDPDAAARAWTRERMAEPLPLHGERLFTTALLRLSPDLHRWFIRAHHIIQDGYCGSLIAHRAAEIYTSLAAAAGTSRRSSATTGRCSPTRRSTGRRSGSSGTAPTGPSGSPTARWRCRCRTRRPSPPQTTGA
ncbi:condensation domain-containing protein [Actinomadura luteofluorescens]|uniref:condensation domain-containing protein n=1 Tax=Actinomadura luteofluorescens TaxID=46163 RepID=UPI0036419A7D